MKSLILMTMILMAWSSTVRASEGLLMEPRKMGSSAGQNSVVYIRQLEDVDPQSHSSLAIQGGLTNVRGLQFGNGISKFSYADASATTFAFHWESTPLSALGHWGAYGGLGYSTYS